MDKKFDADKRRLAGVLSRVAGASALVMAPKWGKPVVDAVMTPAHAQTSPTPAASCGFSERHNDSIALRDVEWNQSMFIPQYDPARGALVKVEVRWSGEIVSLIRLENEETSDTASGLPVESELSASVGAAMSLTGPGTIDFGSISPVVTKSATVTEFDGIVDYDGDSGTTFDPINIAPDPVTIEITDAATLNLFSGSGAVEFRGISDGQTQVFGSANISSSISTQSAMRLRVTYTCV